MGEHVDSKNIRKHKNDVFRLTELLDQGRGEALHIPAAVLSDIREFTKQMKTEAVDLKQLGILGQTKEEILDELNTLYKI